MIFTLGNSSTAKLVLYHAVSSYQLLEVMLHRMIFHKKDRAVLILPDFIVSKYPQYKKLETEKFFHEVYLFPYLFIPHREEDLILKDVTQYYHQMIPYSITDFSNIYVAGAHFYFSLYLIKNQIPFFFFEDAAGIISRSKQLYQILLKKFPVHAKIAQKYGLYDGTSPYICGIICLKEAQTADVSSSKYIDFSVEKALENLSFAKRRKIIRFFLKRPISTNADIILLTQHFANLGIMSLKDQKQLYCNLKDTLPDHVPIAIKKHPDDTLDYRELFPKADLIEEIFPSELLPYVFRKKPAIIYTFDSTGCENLKKHFIIRKIRREVYAKPKKANHC